MNPVLPLCSDLAVGYPPPPMSAAMERFDALYEEHFDFVWRSLRRLGIPESQVDDCGQEVWITAYRRLGDFEGRSSARTWLFGIALNVARNARRTVRRKGGADELDEQRHAHQGPTPETAAERSDARRTLERLLDTLDDDRRAVFVLAELEQMTAPEIAEALGVNVNTVASRLRAAREDFERAAARLRRSAP